MPRQKPKVYLAFLYYYKNNNIYMHMDTYVPVGSYVYVCVFLFLFVWADGEQIFKSNTIMTE